jgi:diguanylate cyclase (GGDEF)-like protein
VSLSAWFGNRKLAIVISTLCAATWAAIDLHYVPDYPSWWYSVWNGSVRLGFFVVTTLLLTSVREAHGRLGELARTDGLTGATNWRTFREIVNAEIHRSSRTGRPFTLACVDMDDFKVVNDRHGHAAGDAVLRTFADAARQRLRSTDVVARLGGDEFALLLPETGSEDARTVLMALRASFAEATERSGWPTRLSIGVVTFHEPPSDAEDALRHADALENEVKQLEKGGMGFAVASRLDGDPTAPMRRAPRTSRDGAVPG